MISYKYEWHPHIPMNSCPNCDAQLNEPDAVILVLSVGGHVFEVRTKLTDGGVLVDTADSAVGKGFHSGTMCHRCRTDLGAYGVKNDSVSVPDISGESTDEFRRD